MKQQQRIDLYLNKKIFFTSQKTVTNLQQLLQKNLIKQKNRKKNKQIMNNLLCKLCTQKLTQPKLCPHCSQIFCQSCITTYLSQKHFCPTCDNYIIDLIDCSRLIQQVQQVINTRNSQNLLNSLCQLHHLQLLYFCNDCKIWICADCGVISNQHKQHNILNRQQTQSCTKEQIIKQLNKLNQKLLTISTKKQKCLLDLQVYKAELQWSKNRIMKYWEDVMRKIQKQGEKQINQLADRIKYKKKEIVNAVNFVKQCQEYPQYLTQNSNKQQKSEKSLKKHLKHISPSTLRQLTQLIKFISKQNKKDINNVTHILSKHSQQIFPNFVNFTYQFDYKNLKDDNFHYSDYFQLWGQDWRLKIYPNGNSTVFGKYLSVFLQLADGYRIQKPKCYIYRIELISLNKAGLTIIKQYNSVFDQGQSWGYSDYLNLNSIHEYLHEGKLFFNIGIRNQTYYGLCNDLKKYIVKIQNQNKVLQKLLCEGQGYGENSEKVYRKNKEEYSEISIAMINLDQASEDIQVSILSS